MKLSSLARILGLLICGGVAARAQLAPVAVGAGSYLPSIPPGVKGPPTDIYVTENVKGPIPTNDWCSSLFWEKFSHPHYAHPLSMNATPAGLRVFAPPVTANKAAIFAFTPDGAADLTIGHSAVAQFGEKRVDGYSDFFVSVRWQQDAARLRLTYGHGSPYVFCEYAGGGARIAFPEAPVVWSGDAKSAVLGITVVGKNYALFAPAGATWEGLGTKELTSKLNGRDYLTVALLPDREAATLQLFASCAHNHVTASRVTWNYDEANADVTTTFTVEVTAREPGAPGTLLALYPHQWRHTKSALLPLEYSTVRGRMKLARGLGFATVTKFPGVLPALPRVPGGADPARVLSYLRQDVGPDDPGVHDTYGEGKMLGRWASLLPIAEQYGDEASAAVLKQRLQARLETWLTASADAAKKRYFAYEPHWGTLIGYPAGYGSDVELNDHHFHYGYFLRAAGELAHHDPAWASDARWGGMLKLLARDIASADRQDPLFPFLRNFDPYAGHSWASGHARFNDGNNQESSSEAMNAWYGMILLGESIGDRAMRDLGVWLYTVEMTGIEEYWFDVYGQNFPPSYPATVVTMVWGGKGANGTWFSAAPEAIHGINFLPVTGGSLYLGLHPAYVKKNWDALLAERHGPLQQWQDILLMYHALSDPADALKGFEQLAPTLKPEGGNSLAGTYHWIATLQALGQVDATVTCDFPLAATFTRDGKRTHVVYRVDDRPAKSVVFSDGVQIPLKAGWGVK